MSHKNKCCKRPNKSNDLEHLIANVLFKDEVFHYEEDCEESDKCGNKRNNCYSCKRDESNRYCGRDFPSVGVYRGDHYDDVIEAILQYIEENE